MRFGKNLVLASTEFGYTLNSNMGTSSPIPKNKNKKEGKIMNNEKVNYLIDIIKDMDIENKLRLAICMCDNYSHTNLNYNKIEIEYCIIKCTL